MTDEEAIRRTQARFCQYLDERRFADWSALFARDGIFQFVSGGREVIHAFILDGELATMPDLFRKHVTANHVIDVDGDHAHAVSDLVLFDRVGEGPWQLHFGRYTDVLVREDGEWLFADRQLLWTANPLDR